MPLPLSDRALRRAVAELATASTADIEAVLEELGPNRRETVRSLLSELVGERAEAPPVNAEADLSEIARRIGLSPWLAARACGHAPGPRGLNLRGEPVAATLQPSFAMTPTTAAALRASVLDAEQGDHAGTRAAGLAWWRGLRRGLGARADVE